MALVSHNIRDPWEEATNLAIASTATIHSAIPYPFDLQPPSSFEGTGFIVDVERGLLLTNRHMVGEGPYIGYAVFQNGTFQCPIKPVYVDPLHDFAICQFDTANLRGSPVKALKLRPDLVKVGLDVRILGNEVGEVMSILQSSISRLDSNPPDYGDTFDALTHYIQASSNTSGGSSGSPVIDVNGHAVAMVAGGYRGAAKDLYLPLDHALRALQCFESGRPILRGTIQSHWILEHPADCRARGVSDDVLQKHGTENSGLLVAERVIENGPSAGKIVEGDVLLAVNGGNVNTLCRLESLMNEAVGKQINVRIARYETEYVFDLKVQDFLKLTPYRLLEFAGSVFHNVRYGAAFRYNVPIKGVLLPMAKGSFSLDGKENNLICLLNSKPTPDLDTFIRVAREITHGTKVAVEYRNLDKPSTLRHAAIVVDRARLRESMTLRTREEDIATWTSTDLCIAAPSTEESLPYKALASAVQVHVRNPDRVNGAWAEEDKLLGLVINADHGFVIVPRSFCPTDMCEVTITFLGDSDDIDAKIVYEHALGFVVVQYDTSGTEGRVKNATFSQRKLKTADETRIFAFNGAGPGVCTTKSAVAAIGSFEIAYGPERFYQPINTEVLHLETGVTCRAGMLLDDKGDIDGLWMTFFGFESISQVGVPASSLMPELECLQQGELPKECRMLDVKLTKGDRSDLRAVNISADAIKNIPQKDFVLVSETSCTHQPQGLVAGDVLLKLGGESITQMSDLRAMFTDKTLSLSIIRNTETIDIEVTTVPISSWRSNKVVWFAGARFEAPYPPTSFCARELYSQILVTETAEGSPAALYRLPCYRFVTAVNGKPTKDFDSFISEIKDLPGNKFCQLVLVAMDGITTTISLMPDQRYFPTKEARKGDEPHEWQFQEL